MYQVKVVSLCAITAMDPERSTVDALDFELDGIVGDRHRGIQRPAFRSDPQETGSLRRNERMWSAVSLEELAAISASMDLDGGLTAGDLTANICFEGFDQLSKLPKGSLLKFPSGLELVVDEFCAPCLEKGQKINEKYDTVSGKTNGPGAFGKAATVRRGLVGVVEVAGRAQVSDIVTIKPYSIRRTSRWTLNI